MAIGRRRAVAILIAGLGMVVLAHLPASHPTAPLFDGVFVEDPYIFVQPALGAVGPPLPVTVSEPVSDGRLPLLAVATAETPPQAQLIAQADAFAVPLGTQSVVTSIQPIAPNDPRVVGNVYRFSITDQAGSALQAHPGAVISIVLRAPQPNPGAQLARFDGTGWVNLPTEQGGLPDLYAANVDQLGDFAVLLADGVASPSAPGPSLGSPPSSPPATDSPNGTGNGGSLNWVVIVFAIVAVGAGVAWGLFGDATRR